MNSAGCQPPVFPSKCRFAVVGISVQLDCHIGINVTEAYLLQDDINATRSYVYNVSEFRLMNII